MDTHGISISLLLNALSKGNNEDLLVEYAYNKYKSIPSFTEFYPILKLGIQRERSMIPWKIQPYHFDRQQAERFILKLLYRFYGEHKYESYVYDTKMLFTELFDQEYDIKEADESSPLIVIFFSDILSNISSQIFRTGVQHFISCLEGNRVYIESINTPLYHKRDEYIISVFKRSFEEAYKKSSHKRVDKEHLLSALKQVFEHSSKYYTYVYSIYEAILPLVK
jgi:hypothetical protein